MNHVNEYPAGNKI